MRAPIFDVCKTTVHWICINIICRYYFSYFSLKHRSAHWPISHVHVETPGPARNVSQIFFFIFKRAEDLKNDSSRFMTNLQPCGTAHTVKRTFDSVSSCHMIKKAQRQVYHRPFVGKYFAKIYYKNINVSTTNHFTLVDKAIYICTHELSHRRAVSQKLRDPDKGCITVLLVQMSQV